MIILTVECGAPNLAQRTFSAVDWIIVRNWQSRDGAIGFGAFTGPTSKHIPVASARVSAYYGKICARAGVLVRYTGWNHDQITRTDINARPILATDTQRRRATKNTEHLMC